MPTDSHCYLFMYVANVHFTIMIRKIHTSYHSHMPDNHILSQGKLAIALIAELSGSLTSLLQVGIQLLEVCTIYFWV